MTPRTHGLLPRVLQAGAIALLALICGIVLHKGFADVSALAEQHRGGDFWTALLRYLFRNLAG